MKSTASRLSRAISSAKGRGSLKDLAAAMSISKDRLLGFMKNSEVPTEKELKFLGLTRRIK